MHMKYLKIVGVVALALFITQCVSSTGEICLFGMRDGSRSLETTWGTSDRVPLSSTELKKQTKIAEKKVEEEINVIYRVAALYCSNRDDIFLNEQLKNKMKELASIQLDKGFAVGTRKALEHALKEDNTSLLYATVLETAGIYREQLVSYCDNNQRAEVPELFQRGYFFHYMNESGYIWFSPQKPAKYCKSILG